MSKKTLLLNSSWEVLNFIVEKRAFKLLYKEKVEVISNWSENIIWSNKEIIQHPAILRLKKHINRNFYKIHFNRKALVSRDEQVCQYCGKLLNPSQITIDHVIPRSQGGLTSFTNCVVSCLNCNYIKANRTPEQAGFKLIKKPLPPLLIDYNLINPKDQWHQDWDYYLNI